MDASTISFALAVLHAGYCVQLCMRQPSQKQVLTRSESRIIWLATSPNITLVGRAASLSLCAYHALLSLSMASHRGGPLLRAVCPAADHLDHRLFAWSAKTIAPLLLLYTACYVRLQAYAQLGVHFTYRLAAPDVLVTHGFYAYVRHPSYTALVAVMLAFRLVFFNERGGPACTGYPFSEHRTSHAVANLALATIGLLLLVRRVAEEEDMMERKFGDEWRAYRQRTKRLIPFLL